MSMVIYPDPPWSFAGEIPICPFLPVHPDCIYIYTYPIATTTWCNSNDLPSYISGIVHSVLFSILTAISLECIIYIIHLITISGNIK